MNRLIKKTIEGIVHPREGMEMIVRNLLGRMIPDELYIQLIAQIRLGYTFNLENPQSFNEKLNWLKLHDHNPLYHILVDKYEVKEHVRKEIGDEHVVNCYGVWDRFEDIDFEKLPTEFVLKSTHDSSGAIVCKNKNDFDYKKAKLHFRHSLSKSNFFHLREWVYKGVKPRIIADKLLDDGSGHELKDYKFWCFNGEPKVMYCTNKAADIFENFYDMEFNPLPISHGFRRVEPEFEKPAEFELMKFLAKKLSANIPFVRIDFFDVKGHVYFGEYTFYDWGGMKEITNAEWNYKLGELIKLPE